MLQSLKKPMDSHTIMNELVLPNDTNTLNNLMGGRLLHWMDIVAAIAAQKHSGKTFLLAKLINNYQKTKIKDNEGNVHKVRVILFAPTAHSESNKIYETLNVDPEDIHLNYSDDQLLNVLKEIKEENNEIKE